MKLKRQIISSLLQAFLPLARWMRACCARAVNTLVAGACHTTFRFADLEVHSHNECHEYHYDSGFGNILRRSMLMLFKSHCIVFMQAGR